METKYSEEKETKPVETVKEESIESPGENTGLLSDHVQDINLTEPKELEEVIINDEKIKHKEDVPEHKEEAIIEPNEVKAELQTIAQILLDTLIDNEKLSKFKKGFNISITDKQLKLITSIISANPDLFKEIEDILKNIIRDNKIDSKDIPDIMMLLQKIYEIIHDLKDLKLNVEKCTETISILVKFVINVLIEEEIIKIDSDIRSGIQENLNKLIDVSMNLILLTTKMKPNFCKDLFFCFK